jgi:hypothetical protein
MTDDSILAQSGGLLLQKTADSRFEIQTEGDLAAGWAMGIFFILGRVIPMFVCSAMLIVIMLIKVDGMARKVVLGVSTSGALVAFSGLAIWAGDREIAVRYLPRNFEFDTERRFLTLRESARWTQTFSFAEVTSANLDFSDQRPGNLALLSIDLRNPHRQLIIQIRRLAEYRRKDRLNEIAAVGEAAAALMGVPFKREARSSSFPAYWI